MMDMEPLSDRYGGNDNHRATISTAISTKRAADTLERIEQILQPPPAVEKPMSPTQRVEAWNLEWCDSKSDTPHWGDKIDWQTAMDIARRLENPLNG